MSKAPQHTIVRFKLRSLLAITFGASIVMAVASPWLRNLDATQQQTLLFGLILLTTCGGAGIYHSILQREKSCQSAGQLLLALPLYSETSKQAVRWTTLLLQLPIFVLFAYILARAFTAISPKHTATLLIGLLPPVLHGWFFGKLFVSAWAEDFGNRLELCDNGLIVGSKFHDWSAPTIKGLHVRKLKPELFVNVKGLRRILPLTDEQHKLAQEILAEKYTPPRDPSPFA